MMLLLTITNHNKVFGKSRDQDNRDVNLKTIWNSGDRHFGLFSTPKNIVHIWVPPIQSQKHIKYSPTFAKIGQNKCDNMYFKCDTLYLWEIQWPVWETVRFNVYLPISGDSQIIQESWRRWNNNTWTVTNLGILESLIFFIPSWLFSFPYINTLTSLQNKSILP